MVLLYAVQKNCYSSHYKCRSSGVFLNVDVIPRGHDMAFHWRSPGMRTVGYRKTSARACPYGTGWTSRNLQSVQIQDKWGTRSNQLRSLLFRIVFNESIFNIRANSVVLESHTHQCLSLTLILQFSSSSTFSSFRSLCTTPFWKRNTILAKT